MENDSFISFLLTLKLLQIEFNFLFYTIYVSTYHDYIKFELTGVVSCKICLTNIQKTGQFCYLWVNTGSCRYCAQLIQNIMFQYCKNLFHFKETIGHTKENVISSIVFLLYRVSIKKLSGKILKIHFLLSGQVLSSQNNVNTCVRHRMF